MSTPSRNKCRNAGTAIMHHNLKIYKSAEPKDSCWMKSAKSVISAFLSPISGLSAHSKSDLQNASLCGLVITGLRRYLPSNPGIYTGGLRPCTSPVWHSKD